METMTLKRLIEILDDSSKSKFSVRDRERLVKVNFIDDYGLGCSKYNAKFYLFYNEFGYTDLVHADNETSAWEAWIDEQETVPMEEVHEAYGAYDAMRDYMIQKGYEDDRHLRDFCNRNCPLFFRWKNAQEHEMDLIEGYHYQSNFTGTGIVDVGHYVGIREASLEEVVVE